MPETIGTIASIKLSSFLADSVNAFDTCMITLLEAGTGASWLFLLWNSRDDAPAVERVRETQRLALAREAAFQNATVHLFTEIESSIVDDIQVDFPTPPVLEIGMFAWGYNANGQLGDGTTLDRNLPELVPNLGAVKSLTAGSQHTLALRSDGAVWAWGSNFAGALGDGSTVDRLTPVEVLGLSGVIALAAEEGYSVALKSDGTVWAWGWNNVGQLGDGSTVNRDAPVQAQNLTDIVAIAADEGNLALKSDGTVWAWGGGAPTLVPNLSGIRAISAKGGHSLALDSGGGVWAWGSNIFGELGDGTTTDRNTPAPVLNLTGIKAISAGQVHSLAIGDDGTVWAWGWNASGQLGDGTTTDRHTPVQVQGLAGVIAIAAGGVHSLALRDDGTVWAWGDNGDSELGDGTYANSLTPVQVKGLVDITAIDAWYQSLAIGAAAGLNALRALDRLAVNPARAGDLQINGFTVRPAARRGADPGE
jgi:Regulator of chromosome condensation (RCC1) repeat